MRIATLALAALLFSPAAAAQADPAFGTCELGTSSIDLESADVRARMFNTGGFFWKGGNAQYEVPNGTGLTSIFAAGLWLAGTIDGEIRATWADYNDWEWHPGPLGPGGGAPTTESCEQNDRFWRVTIDDIAAYNADGTLAADLAEWPAALGAPVVDGDGDPDNYDLAGGDRPAILGGETVWWILNDRGADHRNSDTLPLGLELRVTAFSFPVDYTVERFGGPARSVAQDLALQTFYRFEFTNGNTVDVIDDLSVAWWSDIDLGDFGDDYVGSNPERNLAFGYNSDDDDGVGAGGYGTRPPAIGNVYLNAPLTGFLYYNGSDNEVNGNPSNGQEIYSFLHGVWRNGQVRTYGFDGTNESQPPSEVMFDGVPPDYWSEYDADPAPGQQPIESSDRRYVSYTTGDRLAPGETWVIDKAIVWSQAETGGALGSLRKLFVDTDRTQGLYEAAGLFEPDPRLLTVLPAGSEVDPPVFPGTLGLGERPRPHPVVERSVLDVAVPEGVAASVEVFDALGRLVASLPLVAGQETVAVGALGLAPGSYLARLKADAQVGTRIVQFIVTR